MGRLLLRAGTAIGASAARAAAAADGMAAMAAVAASRPPPSSAQAGLVPSAAGWAGRQAKPPRAAAPSPGPSVKAEVTALSAVVSSPGITQNVLPRQAAICGSVCRYW